MNTAGTMVFHKNQINNKDCESLKMIKRLFKIQISVPFKMKITKYHRTYNFGHINSIALTPIKTIIFLLFEIRNIDYVINYFMLYIIEIFTKHLAADSKIFLPKKLRFLFEKIEIL